jgi:HPt (histidine-containing phosphotransfer) domain-containing protein
MAAEGVPPDIDTEVLARAEAALAHLSASYLSWAEADIRSLTACYARLEAESGDAPLADLFAIAHDMKGQAATLGYPLLTRIGHALCRQIESAPEAVAVIGAHVAALARVVDERMEGDGGEAGRSLLAELGIRP